MAYYYFFSYYSYQSDNAYSINLYKNKLTTCNYQLQFHKTWGQLMKTGYQNSRFAHQVNQVFFGCVRPLLFAHTHYLYT